MKLQARDILATFLPGEEKLPKIVLIWGKEVEIWKQALLKSVIQSPCQLMLTAGLFISFLVVTLGVGFPVIQK